MQWKIEGRGRKAAALNQGRRLGLFAENAFLAGF